MLTPVLNIQSARVSGTIHIRANGSIEPDTTPAVDAERTCESELREDGNTYSRSTKNLPHYTYARGNDQGKSTMSNWFQMGVGDWSISRPTLLETNESSVNVTVLCYDIYDIPLYLASVLILDPVWRYSIYSGFTNGSGVFEAFNIPSGIVDFCVSWGNASAPGEPGYYMYLTGIDATSNVEVAVNAQNLRDGGELAMVTLTLQNSTGEPMIDTLLYPSFNATEGSAFPLGMGPITDAEGIVTLFLANDTWTPEPAYYSFLVCQMEESNNTLLMLGNKLVSTDQDMTLTMPSLGEMATIDLAFSYPSGISLMRDIRLFFEFPQGPQGYLLPLEIDRDALALMYLPSKLHGKMLFLMPAGSSGALFLPVTDVGSTRLCINASMPFGIGALYTNTTDVSGGPWLYLPMKMFTPISPGHIEQISMGGDYMKLRSVACIEANLGSTPKLSANFTDEFFNPLIWIIGEGNTSNPTGIPGIFSHIAIYNLTIRYPNGTIWYDGQAMASDPYGGSNLNGPLLGAPPFPSLDQLGTYTYNLSVDAGPWPLDPPGPPSNPFPGSFEVVEPPALATFGLNKDFNVWAEEDVLSGGNYTTNQLNFYSWIRNEDDATDTVLGDISFLVEGSGISWVDWEEYADWSSSHANWTFPSPDFNINENEEFGPGFNIEHSESRYLNVTLDRAMNETVFAAEGYQMANFTVNFNDTDFLWSWGHIEAHEHWEVNASFIPGTFQTDAPLDGPPHEDTHGIHFGLRKDEIQTSVDYNFSIVVKVEPTGSVMPPIMYKPHFGLGYAAHYHQEPMSGGESYVVEMPPEMLPDHISLAQASTNTSNLWTLEQTDQVWAFLGEVSKPAGARATFSLDRNLDVGTDGDVLLNGDYQAFPNYELSIRNEDDDSDTVLGNLGFYAEAENITSVAWEEYADWSSSYANWTFPSPDFIIHENEGFGTGFSVEPSDMVHINLTIGRWMNQSTFSSDGYQLVRFGAYFANTDFLWSWGHIGAHEHWGVNASIVPGTFQTDAPLDGPPHEDLHEMHYGLDKELIQTGVNYNFSVIIKVEPTEGRTVVYKPDVHIGRGFYHLIAIGPESEMAEMPPGMLPENVVVARVETNSSNYWLLESRSQIMVDLREFVIVQEPTVVLFNLSPNPATVGETVTLRGILLSENGNPLGNENVKLYARPIAGSWRYITSLATNEQGFFGWQAGIPFEGIFIFAAYYPGSESYESTYSFAILIVQ